jgi:hypothetical protein
MDIIIAAEGLDDVAKVLDPKVVEVALILWYDRATTLAQSTLKSNAPTRLQGKIKIMTDGQRPPHWARIYVKSGLAHLLEGGTGSQGSGGGFQHKAPLPFPSVTGIMKQTGLPQPEAFLVARAIFQRGGNKAKPFIRPTYEAIQDRVEQMAGEAVEDAWKGVAP